MLVLYIYHLCNIDGHFVAYDWQIVCSRALVDEDHVKPITTDFKQLGIKKTPAFDRAYKELRHHQELVEASLKGRSSLTKFQNKLADSKKNDIISTDHPVNSPNPKQQPSRKRKSSTPITPQDKPTSVKRPASVPLKKNKKFYQDSPTSSSPKNTSQVLLHFLSLLFCTLFFDVW